MLVQKTLVRVDKLRLTKQLTSTSVMSVQERYDQLRGQILCAVQRNITSSALDELKNNYANEIDSRRKLSRVKDVGGLINLLETRNILNYNNIGPYYYIAKQIVRDPWLTSVLINYENWLQTVQLPQLSNVYLHNTEMTSEVQHSSTSHIFDQINAGSPSGKNANTPPPEVSANRPYPAAPRNANQLNKQVYHQQPNKDASTVCKDERMRQAVLHQVGERLGRSWCDMARYMNIREHQIDEIQNRHPLNLKEQGYEALHLSLSQYCSGKWTINLMRALEKARRKDLKELVEQIILNNECNKCN